MNNDKQELKKHVTSSNKTYQMLSILEVFKYVEKIHIIYLTIGIIGAIISSIAIPLFIAIFGKIVDVFVDYERDKHHLSNSNTSVLIFTFNNISIQNKLDQLDSHLMNQVYFYSSLTALVWISFGFGRFLALYYMQLFSLTYSTKLKQTFFFAILSQNISWYDHQNSGEFASRISNDFKKLESGINENFALIISLIFSAIFNTSCAIYFGWQLALIILSSVPMIAFSFYFSNKYINYYSSKETEIYAQASSIAEESISAIRTVKAFSASENEKMRYNEKLKYGFGNAIRRNMFTGLCTAFDWGILYSFLGIGLYIGVHFIANNLPGYKIGVFTLIFWNAISVGYNFGDIAPHIEAFNVCRSVGANLFKIIDSYKYETNSKSFKQASKLKLKNDHKSEIEFRNINFHYPSRANVQILKNFNLKISSGETIALVGPSGCGKSTIIQLLQRFYVPTSGEIFFNDQNLHELDINWWRDQVGVVEQEPILFDDTIEKNILLGIKNNHYKNSTILEVSKQANAHSFIEILPEKYQTYVGDSGTQLSGGQKQRIAIARALISCPKVLLLDEATSALDVHSEKMVQDALDKAAKNRTTIIVAHRLSTIKNVDRIVVIQNGEIIEEGKHEKLLELKGVYYKMILAQNVLVSEYSNDSIDISKNFSDLHHNCFTNKSVLESNEKQMKDLNIENFIESKGKYKNNECDEKSLISYKRLWSLVKNDKWILLLGVISSLAFGLGTPLYALIYGAFIQEFSENGGNDDGTLVERSNKYVYQFIGIGIGKFFACLLQVIIFGYIGEKLTYKLRYLVYDSIIEQEVEWFDNKENSAGSICAQISDDAANIQSASGLRISTLLQAFSTLSITIPLGFYYNWQMASFSLIFMPIIFGAYLITQKLSTKVASKESNIAKEASKIIVQVMNSIRTVISLNKQEYFYKKFQHYIIEHEQKMKPDILKKSILYGLSMGTSFAAYGFAFLFGGYLVKNSLISVANVFRIVESMIYGAIVIGQTSVLSGDFAKARHAMSNMLKLIDLKNSSNILKEISSSSSSSFSPSYSSSSSSLTYINQKSKGNVQFCDVSFNYPSRPLQNVLNEFTFTVNQGETVALVGTSGCGKSTIIQLLEQFYKPDNGQILIDGKPIQNREWGRRQMALVSQEPILFNCSIRDNIAYGDTSRKITDLEILQVAESTNVIEFLKKLPQGLDTFVGHRGVQLSGGQKQRIAIARALIRNPSILLLDEATSALDTESEKLVQDALYKASKGRTCIVIAHRLKTIVNSSKIIVIHKGRSVEEGKHEQLMEMKGYYWRLFNLYKM